MPNKRANRIEAQGFPEDVRWPRGGAAALGVSAPAIGQAHKTTALRPHAADRPDPLSQGDRRCSPTRSRKLSGKQDQGRHLPELAARQHSRDAAIGAGRLADDDHGGAGVVFELHEADRRVHACRTSSARTDKLQTALDGSIGKEIDEDGRRRRLPRASATCCSAAAISSTRCAPVNKPADCQGLKLRVINSQVYIQTFRALGANPVAMDPSELYLALQQGVVDGFEYPLPDLRRAQALRGDQVRLARPAHHRLLHHLHQQGLWEGMLGGGAGHHQRGDEDGDRLAVEGAAGRTSTDALAQAQDAGGGQRHHAGEQEAVRRGDAAGLQAVRSRRSATISSSWRQRKWVSSGPIWNQRTNSKFMFRVEFWI